MAVVVPVVQEMIAVQLVVLVVDVIETLMVVVVLHYNQLLLMEFLI